MTANLLWSQAEAACFRFDIEIELGFAHDHAIVYILKSGPVAPRVRFLLSKEKDGLKVMVKGRLETEEVIPFEVLKKSVNKAAWAYTDKYVGTREVAGNKGAGLGHRMRKLIK